jgi:hypothetical protein
MSTPVSGKRRRVVPRWRSFASTAKLGELTERRPEKTSIVPSAKLVIENHSTYRDWSRDPSTWNGLDLLGTATVFDDQTKLRPVLQSILQREGVPDFARRIAGQLIQPEMPDVELSPGALQQIRLRTEIAALRANLSFFPRDAIQWVELARAYTIEGIFSHGRRAIRTAVALAPLNRYVLRSAAAFFLQWNDPEQAQRILFNRANKSEDPWLVSAEITAATLADRTSNLIKLGRQLTQASKRPYEISELAASLGTLEIEAGSNRIGRKFLNASVGEPNENALAQVEWLNQNSLEVPIETFNASPPLNHEARVQILQAAGNWREATQQSVRWWIDQPFDVNAAITCSFLLGDISGHSRWAANIAMQGAAANPENMMLKNNLAFNLVRSGEIEKAEKTLNEIRVADRTHQASVVEATWGALEFAKGNRAEGRRRYLQALAIAEDLQDRVTAARAAIYLASEEINAHSEYALETVKMAADLSVGVRNILVEYQIERLFAAARKTSSQEDFSSGQ